MSVYETYTGKAAAQCNKCHECLSLPARLTVESDGTVTCEVCSPDMRAEVAVKPISDAPRDGSRVTVLCRMTTWWSVKLGVWWCEAPSTVPVYYLGPDNADQRGEKPSQ